MRRMLENIFWLGIKELSSLKRDAVLVFLIIFSLTYSVYGPAKSVSNGRGPCLDRRGR
ncbi:MAG: hypothetical protein ACLQU2_37295 [Candidatus Binataceae bacterium]